jgi:Permease family
MKQALIADSFAAMFCSLIGTSTTTSYIESAAGVGFRGQARSGGTRRAVCDQVRGDGLSESLERTA